MAQNNWVLSYSLSTSNLLITRRQLIWRLFSSFGIIITSETIHHYIGEPWYIHTFRIVLCIWSIFYWTMSFWSNIIAIGDKNTFTMTKRTSRWRGVCLFLLLWNPWYICGMIIIDEIYWYVGDFFLFKPSNIVFVQCWD